MTSYITSHAVQIFTLNRRCETTQKSIPDVYLFRVTAPINFTVQFVVAPCILNKRKYFAIIAKSIWHHTQHYKSINNKLPLIHEFGFRRLFLQLTHTLTHNGGLETLDPYTFCLFDLLILCHWRQVKVIYSFKYFRSLKQEQFILGINISIGKKRHITCIIR